MNTKLLSLIGMIIGLSIFSSCSSTPVLKGQLPNNEISQNNSMGNFVIEPGDEIEIRFYYWPDMNVSQVVRPDGKISLNLIDEVNVAGLTINELDQLLTEQYQTKLKDPEIAVIPIEWGSNKIFVGGQVNTPGVVEFRNKVTLIEALFESGGINHTDANLTNVIVMRIKDETQYATSVNVEELLTSPTSKAYTLENGDMVYVTRTGISEANQIVDQYINRMVPSSIVSPAAFFLVGRN